VIPLRADAPLGQSLNALIVLPADSLSVYSLNNKKPNIEDTF
jgi:hypothetical protein